MKVCDYCGKANDENMSFCAECGTDLNVPKEDLSAKKNLPRTLNAKVATTILLALLATQFFSGFFIIFINDIIGLVLSHVLGGIVMILMAFALIPKYLKDTSPTGAAWVLGRRDAMMKGLAIGLIIGVCIQAFILISKSKYYVTYKNLDALNRMAYTPGLQQWVFVVTVIFLAPPVEEMLFRGIFYGGYRKSFGPVWAAVSTTFIFVALHLLEYVHFPSVIMGIIALALATLWCRLHWNAIGPAIAVHAGYNFVVALFIVCWTWH
jgi:membrane protease YdiL (CAAX protease family)